MIDQNSNNNSFAGNHVKGEGNIQKDPIHVDDEFFDDDESLSLNSVHM